MGSMHWTAEESRYLKAIFTWQDRFDDEQDVSARVRDASIQACVGDLRVLMIGAQGVGKTALTTRFCADSFTDKPDERDEPGERFTRGGRRPVRIDKHIYSMDVLEMPAQHFVDLESEPVDVDAEWPIFASTNGSTKIKRRGNYHSARSPAVMVLEQALTIAEAAIVVYDVCNAASFQQASRLYERLLRERDKEAEETERPRPIHASASTKSKTKHRSTLRFRSHKRQRQEEAVSQEPPQSKTRPPRHFALLLVGNKSDVADSERCVAWTEGSNAANAAGGNSFIEASAKTGDKVGDVFVRIGREILEQRAQVKKQSRLQDEDKGCTSHGINHESSSASSSKSKNLPVKIKSQVPRRPFVLRVLGLSFGRRLNTAVL